MLLWVCWSLTGGELGATPNDLRSKKDCRDRPVNDPFILFILCNPPPLTGGRGDRDGDGVKFMRIGEN